MTARTDIGNSAGGGYYSTVDSSVDLGGDSRNPNTSQGVVLHEFMQALSFGHEWVRSARNADCRGFSGTATTGRWTSAYDPYSVSNYTCCWTYGYGWVDGTQQFRAPTLSALDITGLQSAYPGRPASYTVSINEVSVPAARADWKVVGVGDFNGDGLADLAWRAQTNEGSFRILLLDGAGEVLAENTVVINGIADWSVVGIGDFNGDSLADLAWRRQSEEGKAPLNSGDVNGRTALEWRIAAAAR
jgi:hypothetical protein